ncbi:hypothetical protein P171DRAFT_488740 [Karstenula rhodostoma CBS 690.94]|uniref:Uncharacterized protein n=1 Tax=Karstenula rhodostoma CBS 690.94 TaxID=1392251 RepID=A0A9P4U9F8_9PLEO|nr:hypothetical protein P171DRAFT_488740 [Karstenula rhodostoma CBS 690.94]
MAYVLATLVALVSFASANFDLYRIHGQRDTPGSPWGTQPNGYMVFNNDPQCGDVQKDSQFWWARSDVSGNKLGVRCKGKCEVDDWPWPEVEEVEMHFCNDPLYHFTIYKDKGHQDGDTWKWDLLGVDNVKRGECFAYGGYGWDCKWPNLHIWGQRKFRCLTQADAKTLNDCHHGNTKGDDDGPSNATASAVVARSIAWAA